MSTTECIVCFEDLAAAGPGNPCTLHDTAMGWLPAHDRHSPTDVRDAVVQQDTVQSLHALSSEFTHWTVDPEPVKEVAAHDCANGCPARGTVRIPGLEYELDPDCAAHYLDAISSPNTHQEVEVLR